MMLLSGHSRGHIYLFYGATLTGAFSNIPDACCTAFYQPNINGTLYTAPRQQQKSFIFDSVPKLLQFIFIYVFNDVKDLLALFVLGCSLRPLDAALLIDCRSQLVTKGDLYCQSPPHYTLLKSDRLHHRHLLNTLFQTFFSKKAFMNSQM